MGLSLQFQPSHQHRKNMRTRRRQAQPSRLGNEAISGGTRLSPPAYRALDQFQSVGFSTSPRRTGLLGRCSIIGCSARGSMPGEASCEEHIDELRASLVPVDGEVPVHTGNVVNAQPLAQSNASSLLAPDPRSPTPDRGWYIDRCRLAPRAIATSAASLCAPIPSPTR